MSTLQEIEAAVPQLNAEELAELERFVREQRQRQKVENSVAVTFIGSSSCLCVFV